MSGWPPERFRLHLRREDFPKLIRQEIQVRRAAGYAAGKEFDDDLEAAGVREPDERDRDLLELYEDLQSLPIRADFPYREPDALDEILRERPKGQKAAALKLNERELLDRIQGAWLGRCAGCLLGKPLEQPWWTRQTIKDFLENHDAYPLNNYLPVVEDMPDELGYWPTGVLPKGNPILLGNIHGMVRDDDIDFTILNLQLLEQHGLSFTASDVGKLWMMRFPIGQLFASARLAYRNLLHGIQPPESARYLNPACESICAQIRADAFGYACPGRPDEAARLAYVDASVDSMRNGIYGEMAVAAMVARAFASDDPREIVRAGLLVIPARSRYAEMLRKCLEWSKVLPSLDEAIGRALSEIEHATAQNAALSFLAVLYGEGDFEKTICGAVMGGLDTDCNGATAGSIAGVMSGARRIPTKWTSCLEDTVESYVAGSSRLRISDLASRTHALALKLMGKE